MTILILVRHGITEWNKKRKYQGWVSTKLSKEGIKQSKLIAKKLRNKKIGIAYTSDLRRAKETAKIIADKLKIRLVKAKELRELNYGLWSGLTPEQAKEKRKNEWLERKKNKYYYKLPKGESIRDLEKRAMKFIKKIIDKNKGKTMLIVAHNGTNRVIFGNLKGWPKEKIMKHIFPNLKPITIKIND